MRRVTDVPRIARLPRAAHKGDRGRVLVVAGSLRMSGAARLSGWGALRGGAGLVTIATPDVVQPVVAAELPCAMTLPLPSRKGVFTAIGANAARELAAQVDAVAVGPGLTTDAAPFLRRFLAGLDKPVVLDADALNILATDAAILARVATVRVLTPHPGEAARLLGHDFGSDANARRAAAAELADKYDAVVVLKGAGSIVCDGDKYYVDRTGNPGMATGGTGDVLTGLVVARLGQEADAFHAAQQAVHVHSRAGGLAATAVGENAMLATDLVANIAAAMTELTAPSARKKGGGSRRRSGPAR
ncbi:MAG: NAD(P)H-hydrate dehydratase [Planctomycetota bacterium]|jgi:NAD(P)H-hydrate epimerase